MSVPTDFWRKRLVYGCRFSKMVEPREDACDRVKCKIKLDPLPPKHMLVQGLVGMLGTWYHGYPRCLPPTRSDSIDHYIKIWIMGFLSHRCRQMYECKSLPWIYTGCLIMSHGSAAGRRL